MRGLVGGGGSSTKGQDERPEGAGHAAGAADIAVMLRSDPESPGGGRVRFEALPQS